MLSLAYKNIKTSLSNVILMIFMIVVPLLQIGLIKKLTDSAQSVMADNSLVEIVALVPSSSSHLQSFSATVLVQFMLFASMMAGAMLVGERENNTLVRLFTAPLSKLKLLTGILLGHSVVVGIIAAAIIISTKILFDVHWGGIPAVILVTVLAVYVGTALAFIISGIFKTSKVAGAVSSFVIVIMTFLSGGYSSDTESGMVAYFTINKWVNDAYCKVMNGQPMGSLVIDIIAMAIMGTVFMMIALCLYRRENIYE